MNTNMVTKVEKQIVEAEETLNRLTNAQGGSAQSQSFRKDSIKYLTNLIKELKEELVQLSK